MTTKHIKINNVKLLFFILFGFGLNAQNLVSNPSFEINSYCPFELGDLASLASWSRIPAHFDSPDYFHSCSSYVGVPSNMIGNQVAYDGNAYVGLITYYNGQSNYREYIKTHLTSPMIAGQSYIISFYVSCADNCKYSSNNIGAKITQDMIYGNMTNESLNITPNITYSTPISNISGWTLISGTYTSSGNEQYLTIGNFYNDNLTQVENINPLGSYEGAYYYIDQVSVTQSPLGNSNFFLQKNQITPNPVIDKFSIVSNQSEVLTNIELYSTCNRIMSIKPTDSVYDIEDLPSGIYYIILTYESNRKTINKIIKL